MEGNSKNKPEWEGFVAIPKLDGKVMNVLFKNEAPAVQDIIS